MKKGIALSNMKPRLYTQEVHCCNDCPNCVADIPDMDEWLKNDISMNKYLTCSKVENSHIENGLAIASFCPLKILD